MSSDVICIVLVDECAIFRQGLRALLDREPDSVVVGQGENGLDAVSLTRTHHPDVVVMDVSRSGKNGIEATREIRQIEPETKVLGLSERCDRNILAEVVYAGASGYILKTDNFEELMICIRSLHAGKSHFSPQIADCLARILQRPNREVTVRNSVLTARERQILQRIAEGGSTRGIADDLCISHKTVETHRKNIMDKLDLRSVALLTKYAIREGVTSMD